MKRLRAILASLIAVAFIATAAFATMPWMKTFKKQYKMEKSSELYKAKCAVCHVKKNGKGGLNAYGKDLDGKDNCAASLKAIEKKDSDKDGVDNITEIKKGTNPGDKKSKP